MLLCAPAGIACCQILVSSLLVGALLALPFGAARAPKGCLVVLLSSAHALLLLLLLLLKKLLFVLLGRGYVVIFVHSGTTRRPERSSCGFWPLLWPRVECSPGSGCLCVAVREWRWLG
jgi:hypothetical protein